MFEKHGFTRVDWEKFWLAIDTQAEDKESDTPRGSDSEHGPRAGQEAEDGSPEPPA